MEQNKFYRVRAITDIVYIVILVLFFLGCFPISKLQRTQITVYFIFFGIFALSGILFVAGEILLAKSINKNYSSFVAEKKYDEGIAYLQKLRSFPLYCQTNDLKNMLEGLLWVYLDNAEKAVPLFETIDLKGKNSHPSTVSFAFTFLYLFALDSQNVDRTNEILNLYDDKFTWLSQSSAKYKQITDNLSIIEAFRNNDKDVITKLSVKFANIPIFKRLADSNIENIVELPDAETPQPDVSDTENQ